MKNKHFLLLLALGMITCILGSLFKILHWHGSDEVLIAGMSAFLVGALGIVFKLLRHPKRKDFMNS